MNEQLQGKLVEILTGIQEATRAAGDFAIQQLPDIAQSYVVYGRVIHSVAFATFLLLFFASVFVALRLGFFGKQQDTKYGSWADSRCAAAVIGTGTAFFAFIAVFATGSNAALVWFAPKVWLLKELAGLIK